MLASLADRRHHQPDHQRHQGHDPARRHDGDPADADPVDPHRPGGVPPGQQHHRHVADAARTEGQGVDRQHRDPHRGHRQQRRDEQEDVLEGHGPVRHRRIHEEGDQRLLHARNPRNRHQDQIDDFLPALRHGHAPLLSPAVVVTTLLQGVSDFGAVRGSTAGRIGSGALISSGGGSTRNGRAAPSYETRRVFKAGLGRGVEGVPGP